MLGNGELALGCFMDIEGAFDNTGFEVIGKAAREGRMESTTVRWIVRMRRGRTVEQWSVVLVPGRLSLEAVHNAVSSLRFCGAWWWTHFW